MADHAQPVLRDGRIIAGSRDASFLNRPDVHKPKRVHVIVGNTRGQTRNGARLADEGAACNPGRIIIDEGMVDDATRWPEHTRCRRPACARLFQQADEQAAAPPAAFAAPSTLAPDVLAQAEAPWAATDEAADDALAALLGLGPGDGHDELTRCEAPGCDAWLWADCGATVRYESGRELTVCAEHAQPDDPGARIYPGKALAAAWQAQREADESRRIRTTGRAW